MTELLTERVRDLFTPSPKQWDFIRAANHPAVEHVGYGGAIGSGKTQAGGRVIAGWAHEYPADYLVIRKTFPRLRDSTRKAMVRGDGGLPPCIPPELVADVRITDNEVVMKSGGRILFRHAENAEEAIDAFKNMTLGGYLIDQVEELQDGKQPEDGYEQLFDTLEGRLRAPGTPQRGITLSNPGPEDHWYYKRVVDPGTRDPGTVYIHTELRDNQQNLPEKYVRRMLATAEKRPDWFDRYILGKWGAFGGKRFKNFSKAVHVIPGFDIPASWECIEGLDYGWANPFCCLNVALDPWGFYYVTWEHYASMLLISQHAVAIRERRELAASAPSASWLDPSAWTSRGEYASPAMELLEHGIIVAQAQNDRLGGWNHIDELLSKWQHDPRVNEDAPLLRIFSGCSNLIRELPSLKIKDGTDDVEKKHDHSCDALRYVVNARPPKPEVPEKSPLERMENAILKSHLSAREGTLWT